MERTEWRETDEAVDEADSVRGSETVEEADEAEEADSVRGSEAIVM